MVQRQYSEEFKKAAVKKFLSRGSRTIEEICREIGVSNTVYKWCSQYDINGSKMKEPGKRPQDWDSEQKCSAVFEYEKLTEEQRGEYLRSQGLHAEYLVEWKDEIQRCFKNRDHEAVLLKSERSKLQSQVKELQEDLNRKDKALAETAALLVLKKKADLIWGTVETK